MPQVVLGAALAGAGVLSTGLVSASLSLGLSNLGIGLVLSGVSSALMPKRRATLAPQSRTVSVREPVAARPIIYGTVRTGGTIVFLHETGTNAEYLHLVIAIAGHEVESIGAVYFDGEEAIDSGGTATSRYDGLVFIEKKLGATDQTALSQLQADAPDKWTVDHRLRGVAHVHLRLKFDVDVFPRGLPAIAFDVEGKNDIYDPRSATSGFTANAALCLADYMANADYGLGAAIGDEDGIDEAALIAAANICDEAVTLDAGGTEDRYTCNGVLSTAQSPKDNVEALLSAMAGRAVWPGGAWRLHAGAYRTPAVTLTDDDIREAGLSVTSRISRSENFNGVRGQFVSPENDWQPDDFPAYQSATYVTEDQGEEVWRDIVLPFTTSATMAQRLAKIALETQRRQMTVRVAGKLSAWRCTVGETINLTYARWGWSAKPFRVERVRLELQDGQLGTELVLRETSSLVYSWSASEEQIYAAAPRTTLPSAFQIDPPGQPVLTETLYQTRDGTSVRTLLSISWSASASANVERYQVEAKRTLDEDGNATGDDWISLGRTDQLFWEVRDVAPGTWDVRVKALSQIGVSSDYSTAQLAVLGLGAEPAQLTSVAVQAAGGMAIVRWSLSADLDVRIGGRVIIRHSNSTTPSWANSTSLDEVDGNNTIAVVPLKPGTYLIRPQDAGGTLGPVSSVSVKGVQAVPFTGLDAILEHGSPAWAGTKTNCEVNGSDQLTITTLGSDGVYECAGTMDFTTVKAARFRSEIVLTALNLSSTIDDRTDPIDSWPDFDDTEGGDIDAVLEGRFTDDDPSGSPVEWTDWKRIDSTEEECRAAEFRLTLSSASGDYNVLVDELTITADEVV